MQLQMKNIGCGKQLLIFIRLSYAKGVRHYGGNGAQVEMQISTVSTAPYTPKLSFPRHFYGSRGAGYTQLAIHLCASFVKDHVMEMINTQEIMNLGDGVCVSRHS